MKSRTLDIEVKRIYDESEKNDGFRVLVDRIWPRGVSKKTAKIDYWAKEIAPSTELRKWFGHDQDKWSTFKQKYFEELKENSDQLTALKSAMEKKSTITLVYSANDTDHNNAVALKEYLENFSAFT